MSNDRAKELEVALALALQGKRTVASGSKSDKGDAKSSAFRAEAKYRSGEDDLGYVLQLDLQWLEAIYVYADRDKKTPLLALEWEDGRRVFVVPTDVWEDVAIVVTPRMEISRHQRAPKFWSCFSDAVIEATFTNIEVPCKRWSLVPWEHLDAFVEAVQPKEPKQGGFTPRTQVSTLPGAKFAGGGKMSGGGKLGGSSSFGRRKMR